MKAVDRICTYTQAIGTLRSNFYLFGVGVYGGVVVELVEKLSKYIMPAGAM